MAKQDNRPMGPANLTKNAKALARERNVRTPEDSEALSPEDLQKTLHKLQIYHIELEMQNEELRAAQVLIEAGRERYYDLYDLAPVGYCTLSEKGLILEANLTAATLLGTTRSLLIKQPITRFIFNQDQDIHYLHSRQLFDAGEVQEYDLRLLKPDGAFFWAHMKVTAAQAEDGAPVCRVVLVDITKRKQAEAEQEKLQVQLSQAQKMEAIGIMAGGIAHDFNNLIAIVSSNIEAIQIKHQRKIPFEKNVENIITAGSRAKKLIAQILAFSRQEKTDLKPIDLSATIVESLNLLRSTLPKTIEIMNLLPNRPIFIDADSTLMQQVLFNLCNNATYAMKGKGLLKIALNEVCISSLDLPVSSKVPAGIYAKLSISDTGSGIDKDVINKIFDPFFTTKDVGIGTGMGLSVVHGIIEQHGGVITVDSSPGDGTTFNLYFPASANICTELTTSKTEPLPTGTERILFVDDEECIAYTCNELLESLGYKVISVTSGNEALDLFKASPDDFDLVFTDQTMPVMSGAELATELLKTRPDIPIILCSGYSATVSEEDAKGIGIREFCMKPMDKQQLATVARKVLDESGEAT